MPSPAPASAAAPRWPALAVAAGCLVAARTSGLLLHYFSRDPDGNVISASPGQSLLIALPYHGAVILPTVLVLLAGWKVWPRARPVLTALGVPLCLALIVLGQLDLGMQWFIGQRFSPMIFATYIGRSLFTSDLYGPVLHHPLYLAAGLTLMFGPWGLLAWRAVRHRTAPAPGPGWLLLAGLGVLALLCRIPLSLAHGHQRDTHRPPELLFAYHWLHPSETPPVLDEAAAIADLRQLVDPHGTARWLDPRYPLVREAPAGREVRDVPNRPTAPDIFLFCVESLRGADVGYVPGNYAPGEPTPTPRLDALARQGVVFARHLANGNPSPRGFFSLNAGVWDHRSSFLTSGATGTTFDALPARLRRRGYFTLGLWGTDPSFDNQMYWAKKWYDRIGYPAASGGFAILRPYADDAIMDRLLAELATHDRERPGQPVFAYVASAGTHEPFRLQGETRLPAALIDEVNAIPDTRTRYRRVLGVLDAQIGRVIDHLAARRPDRPYLVIVTGDHSDLVTGDIVPPELRDMPHNAAEWTSALIAGPADLLGPLPRVEQFPSSHADFMPTLLDLVGDRGPVAGMGTNLLAPIPPAERTAVSVSGRGYRLDRAGWSLFVLRDDPAAVWTMPAWAPLAERRTGTAGSPFTAEDARRLRQGFDTWSWLIEHNRVWPAAPAP